MVDALVCQKQQPNWFSLALKDATDADQVVTLPSLALFLLNILWNSKEFFINSNALTYSERENL